MVTSIVVPLDGSKLSETAIEAGLALAEGFAAELVLVQATWHRPAEEEQAYLDELVEKIGFPRVRSTTVHGFADVGVSEFVAELGDAVLCLTTHGHSGVGGMLLGTVSHDIVERTVGPVVLVGPAYTGTSIGEGATRARPNGEGPGGPLLFCYDASPAADALEPVVALWAARLGLAVRVVTVLHHERELMGRIPADDVRASAREVVERLRASGLEAGWAWLDGVDAARAITDDAEACGAALVALGATAQRRSHGVAHLTRTLLGTTAERVVHHAGSPVLVLHG